uniref:Protein piccolo n=1 Tax=Plectus sambesii TaxID=2011161 RepID=A0A914XJS7_9BILA
YNDNNGNQQGERRTRSGRARHHRIHRSRRYEPGVKRILLTRDPKDRTMRSLGMKVIGGKLLPETDGELGAYVAAVYKGGALETLGEVREGDQILEWNGIPLTGKTYEEVQRIVSSSFGEIEVIIRSHANLNRVYEMRQSSSVDKGYESATDNINNGHQSAYRLHDYQTGAFDAYSVLVGPPPVPAHQCLDGKASPCFSSTPRAASPVETATLSRQLAGRRQNRDPYLMSYGYLRIAVMFDGPSSTLLVSILSARELPARTGENRSGYPNPFVKIYLLPGRKVQNKRRTKFIPSTLDPDWNQTVAYKDLEWEELRGRYLEFTVWDYDKFSENNFLGQAIISLAGNNILHFTI